MGVSLLRSAAEESVTTVRRCYEELSTVYLVQLPRVGDITF